MKDQESHRINFVILTQDILEDDNTNPIEKIILARITGFDLFFESAAETARVLHTTEIVVQRAKRKLEKIGLIEAVKDTGRGKVYRAALWKTGRRCAEKCTSDLTKKSGQALRKSQTYNKDINKDKVFIGDDNVAGGVENSKKEYGRADVNELTELWESETGISIKGQQNERRQLYNLIRKYGLEATRTLVRRVGATRRSRDRFAPQIAVPSDLTGKYSKLPRMQMWEERNQVSRPFGQSGAVTPAPPMATASIKQGIPDYNGAWAELPDEEYAKVSKMIKEARNKLNL